MKAKAILLFAFLLGGFIAQLQAQSVPQGFTYQAVARDGGALLTNTTFDLRFTIREGATIVYQETHFSATTNNEGLLVVQIGQGTPVLGNFSSLDWSAGPYSLRTEVDNGSGFVLMSDKPLQSVPYALFAEKTNLVCFC